MEGRKRLDSNAREKREEWNTCAMRAKVGAACGEEDGTESGTAGVSEEVERGMSKNRI